MDNFVKCWHCRHYIWFSVNNDNSLAICNIKDACVAEDDTVCEYFLLHEAIYTNKDIPDYCKNYFNSKYMQKEEMP